MEIEGQFRNAQIPPKSRFSHGCAETPQTKAFLDSFEVLPRALRFFDFRFDGVSFRRSFVQAGSKAEPGLVKEFTKAVIDKKYNVTEVPPF